MVVGKESDRGTFIEAQRLHKYGGAAGCLVIMTYILIIG